MNKYLKWIMLAAGLTIFSVVFLMFAVPEVEVMPDEIIPMMIVNPSERPEEHDYEADMAADFNNEFTISYENYGIKGVDELAEVLDVKPYDSTKAIEVSHLYLIQGVKHEYDMIEMFRRHVLMMKLSAVSELRRLELNK